MTLRTGSGDALLIATALVVIALTLIGIRFGIGTFFGEGYDARASDAETLRFVIGRCLERENMFDPLFTLEQCGLDAAVLNSEHVVLLHREDGLNFSHGVTSYATTCLLRDAAEKKSFPLCVSFSGTFDGQTVTGVVGSAQRARRTR